MKPGPELNQHPLFTAVLPAVAGLAGGAAAAWALNAYTEGSILEPGTLLARMVRHPWRALAAGAGTALPFILVEAGALRVHREHFARLPFMARDERRSFEVRLRNAWAWVPSIAGMFVAAAVAWRLNIAVPVAVLGALTPLLLTYPEEARIYRLARMRKPD